jgi:GPH family glycoside/pentoside/hexuronide:cation symporter
MMPDAPVPASDPAEVMASPPTLSGLGSGSAQGRQAALPFFRLLAFSTLALPTYAAQVPVAVYLPAIYGKAFGLSLGTLGVIFLVERLWGTAADPLVGALCDRTRSRFGRRKSWIAAGGAVFGLATVALFLPPTVVTPVYLTVALFAFYLGWSMIQIPYLAWSGDISGAYQERTRIVTYQQVVGSLSLLLVLTLPAIVDQWRPGDPRMKLGAMGATILLTLLPSLILTLRAFSERELPAETRTKRPTLAATMRLVFGEWLLLRILLSDFAIGVAQSIRGALFIFFVTDYMTLPRWASGLFLVQFLFGILAGPLWMTIARRLGKHRTAIAAEILQAIICLALLLVTPGRLTLLLALTLAQGLTQGSGNQMLRSMVADVADRHRLRTGEDRAALFFSVFSISFKAAAAVAVGIALPLVGAAGFQPQAAHNSDAALHGLLLVFALGPALSHLLAAVLLRGFPLDERAYAEIRRALDEQAR